MHIAYVCIIDAAVQNEIKQIARKEFVCMFIKSAFSYVLYDVFFYTEFGVAELESVHEF